MATAEVLAALASAEAAAVDLEAAVDAVKAKTAVLDSRLASLRIAIETPIPPPPPPPPPPPVGAVVGVKVATSQFQTGWVHTQNDVNPITTNRMAILAKSAPLQGQHIQGFGAGKIWPVESGPKNWASLDRLFGPPGHPELGVMKDAKQRFLYLCGCPAWMKAPVAGTKVTQLIPLGDPTAEFVYTPPHRSQYQRFANFAAEIVTRYPQITDVVPWNELKGYFAGGRWVIEEYTEMYNAVYKAVKTARSAVRIGGPYAVLRSLGWSDSGNWSTELFGPYGHTDKRIITALKYWLTNAVGADYFCVDIRNSNADYAQNDWDAPTFTMPVWQTNPQKGTKPTYWPVGPWASWAKLGDFVGWLRAQPRFGNLPVYFMETYANAFVNNFNVNFPNDPESTPAQMASVAAEGMRQMALTGIAGALHWGPDGDSRGRANPLALYNSSGVATAMAPLCQAMAEHFGPGTDLLAVSNLPVGVTVLASATHLLVISTSAAASTFVLDGQAVSLNPYEVRLITRG